MLLVKIISNLQHLYGKLRYKDLDAALLRLNKPMNQMQSVEVMPREIERVQLFLSANPDKEFKLKETSIIRHALIKVMKTCGMDEKGI